MSINPNIFFQPTHLSAPKGAADLALVAEGGAPTPAPTAPGAAPAQGLRPSEAPKFAAGVDALGAGGAGPGGPQGLG